MSSKVSGKTSKRERISMRPPKGLARRLETWARNCSTTPLFSWTSTEQVAYSSTPPGFSAGHKPRNMPVLVQPPRPGLRTLEESFDKGIRDLYRTAQVDGVFCYTFFKAVGVK